MEGAPETLDRRKRKSRAAIKDAFHELLKEKEPAKITVTELARRADIDRKTFYLHYDSIDDLVDSLLYEELMRSADALGDIPLGKDGHMDVQALFEAIGTRLAPGFTERAAILKNVRGDYLIMRLKPLLNKAMLERDSLGLTKELGPYLEPFVAFFCAALLGLYHQWMYTDSELPMETLTSLASAAMAGGIASLTEAARNLDVTKE